ncbi:MAG: transglycosylase SLT domain-containing protein [Gammaproteobacteria bacterium]|nr:transglycosylase SLT domain-containing protein [Gammaproteobacteria bacterium]
MRLKHLSLSVMLIALMSVQHVDASFLDHPVHSGKWTDEYDRYFKKYSKRYFGPLFNWHWFKAQAIAESALNTDAKSHVGARGLMQIMPGTFSDITKQNPHFSQLDTPKWNIAAGIYYDRTLYRKFKKTPAQDKLYMTFASYNAGYGRILNASKRTESKEKNWEEIKPFLPEETRGYVKRIRKLMGEN